MISRVAKWGNSLAVRIPRDAARQLQIGEGGQVDVAVEDGALVVRPVAARKSYDLDSLLAGITDDNLHGETATGAAVGNEL
jgi:antitoxin MazE